MANCDDCRWGHWELKRYFEYDYVCDQGQKTSNWDFECEYFELPIRPTFINDVDVSQCDFYSPYAKTSIINCDGHGGECQDHPNCSYKKLQRYIEEILDA